MPGRGARVGGAGRREACLGRVRYGPLGPGSGLQEMRYTPALGSDASRSAARPRVAIGVKPLRASDAAWVSRMRARGVPTVVDLCDNIFVDGYGGQASAIADSFGDSVRGGLVTVPTTALRDVVRDNTDVAAERVMIVPDIVENARLLHRQMRLLGARPLSTARLPGWGQVGAWAGRGMRALGMRGPVLIWFGNHGASHGSFGLDDLRLWEDALRDAALLGAQLLVVSNHRQRFEAIQGALPIRTRYFQWSPSPVDPPGQKTMRDRPPLTSIAGMTCTVRRGSEIDPRRAAPGGGS